MSRSYKRPFYADQQTWAKRLANRAVRAAQKQALLDEQAGLPDGKQYRKAFDSWDIRDWSFYSAEPKARRK